MTDRPDEHAPLEDHDPGTDPGTDPDAAYPGDVFPEEPHEGDVDAVLGEDAPARSAESTGHPAVDEVLRSLEGLDARPVDEHVGAFEQAHEVLRRALSSAGDDPVARPEG